MSEAFAYMQTLSAADRAVMEEASAWRWVASRGWGIEQPVDDRLHSEWGQVKGHLFHPAHRELMVVLEGGGTFSLNGEIYRRKTGTVFLFDHHEGRDRVRPPHNTAPYKALWVHFVGGRESWLSYNTVALDGEGRSSREISHRVYSGPLVKEVMQAWDRHRAEPEERWGWEHLKALAIALLLDLFRQMRKVEPVQNHLRMVKLVQHYIGEHLHEDLSLATLAGVTGYSPFFFHRVFREQTGQTLKVYIDGERLRLAKERLVEGWSVSAVAEAVGLSTPYAFSRFFRRHVGMPPARWAALERR